MIKGKFSTDEISSNKQHYPLKGKADVVMQNTGDSDVKIGVRVLKKDASIRLAGENTILTNDSISIQFLNNALSKKVWVHYIMPKIDDCQNQ